MIDFLNYIFSTDGFASHGEHFVPDHIGLMWFLIIGNALIALLYIVMPIELSYIYFKRKDFPFSWVFIVVAFFGVWCSMTHIMMIITFWYPAYWLQGIIDTITGVVSFGAFLAFIPATISALKLTSPELLKETNAKLSDEARKHNQIREKLAQKNLELEYAGKELLRRAGELEAANKMMVGRELEMVRLKEDIARLKSN